MKLPVSVFIIACNEAARLEPTLQALAWADQIVLVDSGSTDATIEIAESHGAEVHRRDWPGYGPQKVYAESLCRNPWLLNVDADEVVSPALAREFAALLATDPAPGAYSVRILNVYPGDARPRPFANDYNVVRFYHRQAGAYRDHPLFDRVVLAEGIAAKQFQAPVWHHPLLSWAHFVEKENRYTTYQAETARPRGLLGLKLRLLVEFPLSFLKFYILRRHVTGGWKGLTFSLIAAFGRTLRIAKLLERAGQAGRDRKMGKK